MQIKGEACVEGWVLKVKQKEVLDFQIRHRKKVFFGQDDVIFKCIVPLSPLFTFPPPPGIQVKEIQL